MQILDVATSRQTFLGGPVDAYQLMSILGQCPVDDTADESTDAGDGDADHAATKMSLLINLLGACIFKLAGRGKPQKRNLSLNNWRLFSSRLNSASHDMVHVDEEHRRGW